jgi:hypothetical protein
VSSPTHHDRLVKALRQGPLTLDQLTLALPPMRKKPGARRRAVLEEMRFLMAERHVFAVVNGPLTQYHLRTESTA